jgi:hypothetical protein
MSSTTNIPRWRFWAGADTPLAVGQTDDTLQSGGPFRIRGVGYFLAKAGSIAGWNIAQKNWGTNGDGLYSNENWIWSTDLNYVMDSSGSLTIKTFGTNSINIGVLRIGNNGTNYINFGNNGIMYARGAVLSDIEIRSNTTSGGVYPLSIFPSTFGGNVALNVKDTDNEQIGWLGYGEAPGGALQFGMRSRGTIQLRSNNGGDINIEPVQGSAGSRGSVNLIGLSTGTTADKYLTQDGNTVRSISASDTSGYHFDSNQSAKRVIKIAASNVTEPSLSNDGDILLVYTV